MTSYVLFIYGMFDDLEEVEFYCNEVLLQNPVVNGLKFIVENNKNLIVIMDSEFPQEHFTNEIHKDLIDQNVKFYFMFKREELVSAHLPEQVKKFIFEPAQDSFIQITYSKTPKKTEFLDLDDLLEKIKKEGIDSLTSDEKKFLDDFDY
jgi:hypothetical protein